MSSCLPAERSGTGLDWRPSSREGFTLLEIMIVVGLLGLILAVGLPPMVRIIKMAPLHQAVSDVMEGLNQARAQAIFHGLPARFLIRGDGYVRVPFPAQPVGAGGSSPEEDAIRSSPAPNGSDPGMAFHATLDSRVIIRFIGVNLVEQMDADEVEVVFYPSGTSDDFTIVLEDPSGVRAISVDPVTAFAEVKVIR